MASDVANGSSRRRRTVDGDWTSLAPARQRALLRGGKPADGEEAVIALGYSRRMMGQAWLMGVVAALVALVVSLAMSWFLDGSLQRDAWFRAIAIGIGVGLGIAVVRRLYGSRLHRNAKETLGM